jgi:hypothetical protein
MDGYPVPIQEWRACCLPGGECEITTIATCDQLGGIWHGESLECSPNSCPAMCCFSLPGIWGCEILLEQECLQQLGEWHPEWTTWGQIKLRYR